MYKIQGPFLRVCFGHLNSNINPFIVGYNKEIFNTKDRGAPKSAGPIAIATFATIVNPALTLRHISIKRCTFSRKIF